MNGKGKSGRPAKGGGRLNLRLSSHTRALLGQHTKGQVYEGEGGVEVVVPALPSYPNMTAMVEHGISLASRKDLVPCLTDDPGYRASRKKMARILADSDVNIRISLACFFKRFGRERSRWSVNAIWQKRLLNSIIWFRGRLILAVAEETRQPVPARLLAQLRALAHEERFFRTRRQ
jgi:hypothetical protein